jgi:hypothetical protein
MALRGHPLCVQATLSSLAPQAAPVFSSSRLLMRCAPRQVQLEKTPAGDEARGKSNQMLRAALPEERCACDDSVIINSSISQVVFLFCVDVLHLEFHPVRQFILYKADCRPNLLLQVRVVDC